MAGITNLQAEGNRTPGRGFKTPAIGTNIKVSNEKLDPLQERLDLPIPRRFCGLKDGPLVRFFVLGYMTPSDRSTWNLTFAAGTDTPHRLASSSALRHCLTASIGMSNSAA